MDTEHTFTKNADVFYILCSIFVKWVSKYEHCMLNTIPCRQSVWSNFVNKTFRVDGIVELTYAFHFDRLQQLFNYHFKVPTDWLRDGYSHAVHHQHFIVSALVSSCKYTQLTLFEYLIILMKNTNSIFGDKLIKVVQI